MPLRAARSLIVCLAGLALLAAAAPAHAGPPLLCHPFDIGEARSLPWDGSRSWSHGRADYALTNLVRDTESLLTPSTPVIVRMETLRRAAIYASRDRAVAERLLEGVVARARTAEASARPDALAWLDAALLTGMYRQLGMLGSSAEFRDRASTVRAVVGDADGLAWMTKCVNARPDDAAVQFASAMIVSDSDRKAFAAFARKAREGASRDPLLARNLGLLS